MIYFQSHNFSHSFTISIDKMKFDTVSTNVSKFDTLYVANLPYLAEW